MIEIFYFDQTVKRAQIHELEHLKGKKVWIDIINLSKEEADLLGTLFNLHPLTIEDLLKANCRIKVEEFNDYMISVAYGIVKNGNFELVEVDTVLGEHFIITSHPTEISACAELKTSPDKLDGLFKKGVDFIFHHILDKEIDNYFSVLESIDEELEEIEEKVTDSPSQELLKSILKLKKHIIFIKKVAIPQREKISFLAKNEHKYITKKATPYFRDVYDHAVRVADTIENYREAISNTFEIYMSSISNNMDRVMKNLSLIATIALPLTVVSSIYGTNFQFLPGAGHPYGFFFMLGFMACLSIALMYMFKNRHLF
jgi:magnesium transporter